jgi:nucleoside-specific outer membrane channel protein Tsx
MATQRWQSIGHAFQQERVFVNDNGQHNEQTFSAAYLGHLHEVEISNPANTSLDVWQDWNRWQAERRLWNQYRKSAMISWEVCADHDCS